MSDQIQSQMQPPPVAMQFVVTLYYHANEITEDSTKALANLVGFKVLGLGVQRPDVVFLPAPVMDGSQDG